MGNDYDLIKKEDEDENKEECGDSEDEGRLKDRSSIRTTSTSAASTRTNYDSDDNKMETLDVMPLDLSVRSELRDNYLERRGTPPPSPICRDSCTDSEDSDGGPGGKGNGGKAYKKSLMKRYRKSFCSVLGS